MRSQLVSAFFVATLLASCKEAEKKESTQDVSVTDSTAISTNVSVENQAAAPAAFDINSVAVAENFSAAFPYFQLPPGYVFTDPNKYHGKGEVKDFDREYIYHSGSYTATEGKSFKAEIRLDEKAPDKKFSALEIQKSFDDAIKNLGGVKINNGEKQSDAAKEQLKKDDPNAYTSGYLHAGNNFENVHAYIIRAKDKTVFVQYNLGTENAALTVMDVKVFENKMELMPAKKIEQDLNEKGKAVLYINFDTDQATLRPDGKKAVQEIAIVLNANPDLKLSIEGHTDNTGSVAHNKKLSEDRAAAVVAELTSAKIASARLQAKGFGSEKPLTENNSEEKKAKNRRVELVKI